MTPDEAPKLSPWPFIAVDALLLGSAFLIGYQTPAPVTGTPLIVIGVLVFAGAAVAVVPWLLNHTRRQEAELRERQQEIAALAQTTAASAEQLSIAAASLHTIAENASRAVKHTEQLPHKLQEKIHEFKQQLNEVTVSENEALSQEVNTLRAAETERLEGLVTTVRKLSSEFSRLEASSRKNVTELTEALNRFTTSAEQAAAESTTAIASVRAGAEKSLASAQANATAAIESSLHQALAEIESKLGTLSGQLTAKVQHATEVLDARIAKLEALSGRGEAEPVTRARARKSPPAETQTGEGPPAPVSAIVPEGDVLGGGGINAAPNVAAVETLPVSRMPVMHTEPQGETAAPPEESAKPARRPRAARRGENDDELTLGLELPPADEFSQVAHDAEPISSVSVDGATRLLVTSYIGIGNKLFVRGEGPGLSWDKGVPLQFVSIGKWRWESPDATEAARLKLFKNDEVECTALGEIVVEPGHQKEVAASF